MGRHPVVRGQEGRHALEDRRALLRRRESLPEELRGESGYAQGSQPHQDRAATPHSLTGRNTNREGGSMLRHWCYRIAVVAVGLVLTACASDKDPAEKALRAAEDAIGAVKAEAQQYVPDQLAATEAALKSAGDSFTKGDYKAVLAAAPDISTTAKALSDAAAAKKAELAKNWESASAGLPRVVDAIKSRVDILEQAKKLPPNLDKAAVDRAKSGLDEISKLWNDAQDAFKSGNVPDAIAKVGAAKTRAAEIMTQLGMEVPEALKKS